MRVIYRHGSKVLGNFYPCAQRAICATEARVRRKAAKLGYFAKKHRGDQATYWSLLTAKGGTPVSDRMYADDLEYYLNALLREPRQPRPVQVEAGKPLTFSERVALSARRMLVWQQLIQQHAERPSMGARLRQLLGDRPPAVEVLRRALAPSAGHVQRNM